MPSLDEVYQKFGAVAEAAALLETELCNMLLVSRATEKGLLEKPDPEAATSILETIDRSTLGQLIKGMGKPPPLSDLEDLLSKALRERNRLFHAFYRHHNFRRNSEDGRAIMWSDLDAIHETLIRAYKALMLLSGIDLDALANSGEPPLPTGITVTVQAPNFVRCCCDTNVTGTDRAETAADG